METLIEKIKALHVLHQPYNHWEGTKFRPGTHKYVKLEDVLKLIQDHENNNTAILKPLGSNRNEDK